MDQVETSRLVSLLSSRGLDTSEGICSILADMMQALKCANITIRPKAM